MIDGSFFGEPKQRWTKNHRKQSVWNAGPLPIWMICLFVNQTSVCLSKNDIKLTIVHLLIIQNDKIPNDITNVLCLSFVKLSENTGIRQHFYRIINLQSNGFNVHITALHHRPWSPSSGNSTLQKTDEEATKVKKESDRNRSKTRVNGRAFTRWRAPVLCQRMFPRWFVFRLTTVVLSTRSASDKTCVRINTTIS